MQSLSDAGEAMCNDVRILARRGIGRHLEEEPLAGVRGFITHTNSAPTPSCSEGFMEDYGGLQPLKYEYAFGSLSRPFLRRLPRFVCPWHELFWLNRNNGKRRLCA